MDELSQVGVADGALSELRITYFFLCSAQTVAEIISNNPEHYLLELLQLIREAIRSTMPSKGCLALGELQEHFLSWNLPDNRRILLCTASDGVLLQSTRRLMWPDPKELLAHVRTKTSFASISKEKVVILSAESGAGKTHAMFTANPNGITVVLLMYDDFPTDEDSERNRVKFVSHFRRLVKEAVENVQQSLTTKGFGRLARALPMEVRQRVHIVLDEAYSRHKFVRCLCRWRNFVVASLVDYEAPFDGFQEDSLRFACAGTGLSTPLCEDLNLDAGSFEIIVSPQAVKWRCLCPEDDVALKNIVEAALKHPSLHLLEDNARSSLLCLKELEKLVPLIHRKHVGQQLNEKATAVVSRSAHHVFDTVVKNYCMMNALDLIRDSTQMGQLARAAIRLTLCGEETPKFCRFQLVVRFGAVTDLERRVKTSVNVPLYCPETT